MAEACGKATTWPDVVEILVVFSPFLALLLIPLVLAIRGDL